MNAIAAALGFSGFIQVESWFLYSPRMANKKRVFAGLQQYEPSYFEYQRHLTNLLQRAECVLAWAAADNVSSLHGAGVSMKADILGLREGNCSLLELERKVEPTQTLFYSNAGGRFRGAFLAKGNPILPARFSKRSGMDRYAVLSQIRFR